MTTELEVLQRSRSQDPDDLAAAVGVLRERLRAGITTEERVRCAAPIDKAAAALFPVPEEKISARRFGAAFTEEERRTLLLDAAARARVKLPLFAEADELANLIAIMKRSLAQVVASNLFPMTEEQAKEDRRMEAIAVAKRLVALLGDEENPHSDRVQGYRIQGVIRCAALAIDAHPGKLLSGLMDAAVSSPLGPNGKENVHLRAERLRQDSLMARVLLGEVRLDRKEPLI